MKAKLIFIGMKQKNKYFKNQKTKKLSFSNSTNIQYTILEQFLEFKACKSGDIDAISMEVAQQMKLSGCPTKGHFKVRIF